MGQCSFWETLMVKMRRQYLGIMEDGRCVSILFLCIPFLTLHSLIFFMLDWGYEYGRNAAYRAVEAKCNTLKRPYDDTCEPFLFRQRITQWETRWRTCQEACINWRWQAWGTKSWRLWPRQLMQYALWLALWPICRHPHVRRSVEPIGPARFPCSSTLCMMKLTITKEGDFTEHLSHDVLVYRISISFTPRSQNSPWSR